MSVIFAPDRRRAVETDPLRNDVAYDPKLRHTVVAATAEGKTRVWFTLTREAAREVARAYRAHGGKGSYIRPPTPTRDRMIA
jgi:hypothetical protein